MGSPVFAPAKKITRYLETAVPSGTKKRLLTRTGNSATATLRVDRREGKKNKKRKKKGEEKPKEKKRRGKVLLK